MGRTTLTTRAPSTSSRSGACKRPTLRLFRPRSARGCAGRAGPWIGSSGRITSDSRNARLKITMKVVAAAMSDFGAQPATRRGMRLGGRGWAPRVACLHAGACEAAAERAPSARDGKADARSSGCCEHFARLCAGALDRVARLVDSAFSAFQIAFRLPCGMALRSGASAGRRPLEVRGKKRPTST